MTSSLSIRKFWSRGDESTGNQKHLVSHAFNYCCNFFSVNFRDNTRNALKPKWTHHDLCLSCECTCLNKYASVLFYIALKPSDITTRAADGVCNSSSKFSCWPWNVLHVALNCDIDTLSALRLNHQVRLQFTDPFFYWDRRNIIPHIYYNSKTS